jgi:hypothetical protein
MSDSIPRFLRYRVNPTHGRCMFWEPVRYRPAKKARSPAEMMGEGNII